MANIFTTKYWPDILAPSKIRMVAMNQTTGGGRTLSAREKVVQSNSGFWVVTLGEIPIVKPVQVIEWRAIEAYLEGRYGQIMVPVCDGNNEPWPIDGGVTLQPDPQPFIGSPTTGGGPWVVPFSDDTDFIQPCINVTAFGAINIGDTSGTLRIVSGNWPLPGNYFGDIANGSVYRITYTERNSDAPYPPFSSYKIQVKWWPPARAQIPNGTLLEFDKPLLRCNLQKDTGMDTVFDYNKYARPSITFEEAIP